MVSSRHFIDKFIKHLTRKGKKPKAEKIFINCLKELQVHSKKNPLTVVKHAVLNAMPMFKIRLYKRKKSRKANKVFREQPYAIKSASTRISLAMNYILTAARKNSEGSAFFKKLGSEVLAAAQNKGSAIQLRDEGQKFITTRKSFYRSFYRF